MRKVTYGKTGDNYDTKDPIKKLAQKSAQTTAKNLIQHGFTEISDSRGESAYVWKQNGVHMASVIEGLGTKNLIADEMRKITGRTYYDNIAYDTVATIINDLLTVGATPLVLNAYWAIEDNAWLADKKRMNDLISGWRKACDAAGVSWGGGETATLKQILIKGVSEFGGSAVGIIKDVNNLITDKGLRIGDRIVLIKSSGINANGASLARSVAKKLTKGYGTRMSNGKMFGDALLVRSNIYAKLIHDLQKSNIDIHYIANITGHGIRKIMRARGNFTYLIEKIFTPPEVFKFIQDNSGLDDFEMYQTYNMGQDYALFLPPSEVDDTLSLIRKNNFKAIDAGVVEKSPRQVIIKPKNLTYSSETLDLRR